MKTRCSFFSIKKEKDFAHRPWRTWQKHCKHPKDITTREAQKTICQHKASTAHSSIKFFRFLACA